MTRVKLYFGTGPYTYGAHVHFDIGDKRYSVNLDSMDRIELQFEDGVIVPESLERVVKTYVEQRAQHKND
jgi:hypothetical protein